MPDPGPSPFGMPAAEYYQKHGILHRSEFIQNSRGISLFTQSWRPANQTVLAVMLVCHGYGNDSSWLVQVTSIQFALQGMDVFALDYEGHGQSDGLQCGIRNFQTLLDDCLSHFKNVKAAPELQGLPVFIYGESLGGAVAIQMLKKVPDLANGVILASPMCKISDALRPHWIVMEVFRGLAALMPNAAIAPARLSLDKSFRDPAKRALAAGHPRMYRGRPRLGFAAELLKVTDQIASEMEAVTFPFIVIHGEDDQVTDPAVSKELYERASSVDKTLKLYPHAWHMLLAGEPEEVSSVVWADVLEWLQARIQATKA